MRSRWARSGTVSVLVLMVAVLPGPWGSDGVPAVGPAIPGVPGDPVRGARLFRRSDCTRCHTAPRGGRGVDVPPSLEFAGSRAQAAWLASWLPDPQPLRYAAEGVRPRIRMPALRATPRETEDLVAYLATLRDSAAFASARSRVTADSSQVAEGEMLFEQYQCRGCHRLGGAGGGIGPALDEVGRRRRPEYIAGLLRDPHRVVPGTAMKNLDLWDEEVGALTSYLMTLDDAPPSGGNAGGFGTGTTRPSLEPPKTGGTRNVQANRPFRRRHDPGGVGFRHDGLSCGWRVGL